jgi:hypothetical protein
MKNRIFAMLLSLLMIAGLTMPALAHSNPADKYDCTYCCIETCLHLGAIDLVAEQAEIIFIDIRNYFAPNLSFNQIIETFGESVLDSLRNKYLGASFYEKFGVELKEILRTERNVITCCQWQMPGIRSHILHFGTWYGNIFICNRVEIIAEEVCMNCGMLLRRIVNVFPGCGGVCPVN